MELEDNVDTLKRLVSQSIELHPSKKASEQNYTGHMKKLATIIFDITENFKR